MGYVVTVHHGPSFLPKGTQVVSASRSKLLETPGSAHGFQQRLIVAVATPTVELALKIVAGCTVESGTENSAQSVQYGILLGIQ